MCPKSRGWFDRSMRSWRLRFRRNHRGLSEIVGTLMLIVIVVTAATLLAAFVASYQKQVQNQEAYAHEQSLESIKILGLETALNAAGTGYRNINFTMASESVDSSNVLGIAVNNVALSTYWWHNVSDQTWHESGLDIASSQVLTSLQQIFISTNTSATNDSYSLGTTPLPNQYLKIDVYTVLQNDFRQVFLPPAPIALVSEINPSGNNPITLLDGSTSFQPGGNATLVNWAWTVSGGGLSSSGTSLAAATFSPDGNGVISGPVNETVTGATASFAVPAGFAWEPQDSVVFALAAENLTVVGTGTCSLSDSTISSSSGAPPLAGTLTVTFSFTTTISSGCTDATVSLAASGVTFLASAGQIVATAYGEESEISPALPVVPATQASYVVGLQVENSNGMTGSISVSYEPPV